ncbi:hypothetical protein CEE44_03505 [Candidatus Woesearchaeota archaeon B3_Woes]|nr:MAG: hypothetical protein CEE44_03505 [Candidatus Woesearchaeota archaeon B3_Woes]
MNSEKIRFSNVIRKLKFIRKLKVHKVLGKKIIIFPKVFDPDYFDSQLLAKTINKINLNVKDALELGTGCGIQSFFIAKKAERITTTDINSFALENAKLNFELYNLHDKIEIVKSDLFSNITNKYDLIVFNPPFFSIKPKDLLEKTVTSYNNSVLKRFFRDVPQFLKDNGKIIIIFSDIGNIGYFHELMDKHFSQIKILSHQEYDGYNYFVYMMENAK